MSRGLFLVFFYRIVPGFYIGLDPLGRTDLIHFLKVENQGWVRCFLLVPECRGGCSPY